MEIHFVKNAKNKTLSRTQFSVALVPEERFQSYLNSLDADIKNQLEENSDNHSKDSPPKAQSFHFTEGGKLSVVPVKKTESVFNFHTKLRKALNADFKRKHKAPIRVFASSLNAKQSEIAINALCSLAHLAPWKVQSFGKKAQKQSPRFENAFEFESSLSPAELKKIVAEAQALANATNLVRDLALLPGNMLTPSLYRERAANFAREKKLKVEFLDKKELKKRGAGAFLAVTQADPNSEGGILCLRYPGTQKKKGHIALVGKGLCFDTGGYNVKTGNYMFGMHEDMTGSAVALATLGLLADLKFPYEVRAYLALAENHISPTGFKPNDVVIASNGLSIEVENTDAEGRMVLSDTLAIASKEQPLLMLDFATLTGACFRPLGTARSGAFSNQEKLAELALLAGEASGERVWTFPIGDDYEEALESPVADLRQCASVVNADHIYAATFLNHFVEKTVPWLHVDLSAHAHKGGLGLVASETNGFGCRFSYELIKRYFKL